MMSKEIEQYLGLGGYQSYDFSNQIADATLCYPTCTVMTLEERFREYRTVGGLFSDMKDNFMTLAL